MMRRLLAVLVFLPLTAFAYTSPGRPVGFVNDFAQMMSESARVSLEADLTTFRSETSNELVVVTLATLEGDVIENVAVKLFAEWGIGTEKNDNGVLLLVARDEREVRIEVGYGLEGALTDIESKEIIDSVIVPRFQAGDFDGGITGGLGAIKEAISGEYVGSGSSDSKIGGALGDLLLFGFWILFHLVFGLFAKSKSWWLGGVVGGVVGTIIGIVNASVATGAIVSAILIPLGLIIDFFVSKYAHRPGGRGPGGFGGFGGFGKGGGGFGGFGGGMSGGGGSSGRW